MCYDYTPAKPVAYIDPRDGAQEYGLIQPAASRLPDGRQDLYTRSSVRNETLEDVIHLICSDFTFQIPMDYAQHLIQRIRALKSE